MSEDLSEARSAWDRRDDVQFVDVREADEWQAGGIEGASHVPLNTLLSGEDAGLDPSRPVIAYCTVGARSEVAKLMLQARGFEAYNLEGGLATWLAQGLPIITPDGAPGRLA